MKKFITDTLFISVGGLLSKMKGIVFLPIIIAAVGLSNYGAFVQIYANTKILIPLSTLSLGMGFQRFASTIPDDDKKSLSLHFYSVMIPTSILGIFASFILYFSSRFINDWFLEGRFLESLQISSIMVLSNTLYTNLNKYLLARKKFKLDSILGLTYSLLPYFGFVTGLLIYDKIFFGILFYATIDLLVVITLLLYLLKDLNYVRPSKLLFKKYLSFSYPLALSNIEGGLLTKVDKYFLSFYLGMEALGIYNIVQRITDFVSFVSVPIRKQMLSYLPKVWDQGYISESIQIIKSSLLVFSLISIGLLGFLTFYFSSIIEIFISKTIEIQNLEILVFILGLAAILSGAKVFYYNLLRLKKETKFELFYQFIGMFINIILNFILLPSIGMLGAAISSFFSYLSIILLINYKHSVKIDSKFLLHIISFLSIGVIFYIVSSIFPPAGIYYFTFSTIVSFILYISLNLFLKKRLFNTIKIDLYFYKSLINNKSKHS